MKRLLFGLLIFTLTLGAGYGLAKFFAVFQPTSEKPQPESPSVEDTRIIVEDVSSNIEFEDLPTPDEFPDWALPNKLIDIFETDALYRESEVVAREGESWLVLLSKNGKYYLKKSKASIKRLKSVSYPGDEHDVKLRFAVKGQPILAVRGIKSVKAGPIQTIYQRPSSKEIEDRNLPILAMQTGFDRDFKLNEKWYKLRVANGMATDKTSVSALVLEHAGQSQILTVNYDSIIGELFWVGDLDNDGKLDLYFDWFNEKGAFVVQLYLSSAAKPNQLVKAVAVFSRAGC